MKLTFTLIVLCFSLALMAQKAGTLDSSFGVNGKVISENYQGVALASLLQPDGKIVIGGGGSYYKGDSLLRGSLLARYNTDGSPDLSFADSGRGAYILGDLPYIPTIQSVALEPDGKIVALGNIAVQDGVFGGFSLMRFNPDGSPDISFGINGLVLGNITGEWDAAFQVATLSDGRIVVAGKLQTNTSNNKGFVACYTQQGNLDRTFGDAGIVNINLGEPLLLNSVVTTTDDKIIAGGGYDGYEILLKYNNNGTPDLTFGDSGLAKMSFPDAKYGTTIKDIAIDNKGRIVTGGLFGVQFKSAIKAGRFTEDGFTDTSFNKYGYAYTNYRTGDPYANAVAAQQNGKVIVAGYHTVGDSGTFTAIRYDEDGSLDSAFGTNGIQDTYFFGDDVAYSINIQPDGKIILVGYSQLLYEQHIDIARYNSDETKTRKQILITKIKRWIQHHNGIEWNNMPGTQSYAVQKSIDGQHWTTVYRSQVTAYSAHYSDPAPSSTGTTYYRLQTTSTSNAVANSNVIAISYQPLAISLSPNPAKNTLSITGLPINEKVKITVVDFSGNTAISQQLLANSQLYNFDISSLHAGNYVLKVETGTASVAKQFVKE